MEDGKSAMKMSRSSFLMFTSAIILILLPLQSPQAQQKQTSSGERVVVCMIRLEHADAEHLASVLKPFLSPQGSLSAYAPTNTLIIKDRASIVNMLAEIIKGEPCTPIAPAPQSDGTTGLDKHLP
jgi:type II secretory pathway component GspD/PulD (secretin)